MTSVTFHTEGRRIIGFEAKGHSGFAPEGEDIVCAAITSTVRLVECTINDVLGLSANVKVNEKTATITLRLPNALSAGADSTCQALLTAMMVYLSELHDEYPEFIEVLEA